MVKLNEGRISLSEGFIEDINEVPFIQNKGTFYPASKDEFPELLQKIIFFRLSNGRSELKQGYYVLLYITEDGESKNYEKGVYLIRMVRDKGNFRPSKKFIYKLTDDISKHKTWNLVRELVNDPGFIVNVLDTNLYNTSV